MHLFPVVGKKQNDAQAKKNRSDAKKNNSAPGRSLFRFLIAAFYTFSLISDNEPIIEPQIYFSQKPFNVFFHDNSLDKPPALPLRIEPVIPLPGDHVTLI